MKNYRTVFISDIHLGSRISQADKLLDFLKTFEAEQIFLVGDIIDGWAMQNKKFWPQPHNDVVQKFLRKSRKGTKIVYVPGNHDEFMRSYCNAEFGQVFLQLEAEHIGVDGKKYLVTHGDQFDIITTHAKWVSYLGSWAYDFTIWINHELNVVRSALGMKHWSLSSYLKQRVKESVNFIGNYEKSLSDYVHKKGYNGIVCGHIHHANIRTIENITYINCGDWVESLTAIVEHYDGKFEIIRWNP